MFRHLLVATFLYPFLNLSAATTLPVGPITFSTDLDYDRNFKESPSLNGILRSPNGYLQVQGVPNAIAAFDTSASGGMNGSGGTGGTDANNDLSNFTISADVASSMANGIGIGFLLRMNDAEANGYFAGLITQTTTLVEFSVFEGAGFNTIGTRIFSMTMPLPQGTILTPNTFYPFKVTITGGTFFLDFASGAATASFTDPTVSATTGQVGFVLATNGPFAATRLDNFAIVPEPNSAALILLFGLGFLAVARKRPNKPFDYIPRPPHASFVFASDGLT